MTKVARLGSGAEVPLGHDVETVSELAPTEVGQGIKEVRARKGDRRHSETAGAMFDVRPSCHPTDPGATLTPPGSSGRSRRTDLGDVDKRTGVAIGSFKSDTTGLLACTPSTATTSWVVS